MLTPTVAAALFEDYPNLPAEDAVDALNAFEDADDECLRGAWKLLLFRPDAYTRKTFYLLLDQRRRAALAGKARGGRPAGKAKE